MAGAAMPASPFTGVQGPDKKSEDSFRENSDQVICGTPVLWFCHQVAEAPSRKAAQQKRIAWDLGTKATALSTLVQASAEMPPPPPPPTSPSNGGPTSTNTATAATVPFVKFQGPLPVKWHHEMLIRCNLIHGAGFNKLFQPRFWDLIEYLWKIAQKEGVLWREEAAESQVQHYNIQGKLSQGRSATTAGTGTWKWVWDEQAVGQVEVAKEWLRALSLRRDAQFHVAASARPSEPPSAYSVPQRLVLAAAPSRQSKGVMVPGPKGKSLCAASWENTYASKSENGTYNSTSHSKGDGDSDDALPPGLPSMVARVDDLLSLEASLMLLKLHGAKDTAASGDLGHQCSGDNGQQDGFDGNNSHNDFNHHISDVFDQEDHDDDDDNDDDDGDELPPIFPLSQPRLEQRSTVAFSELLNLYQAGRVEASQGSDTSASASMVQARQGARLDGPSRMQKSRWAK